MKHLIICGTGAFARELYWHAQDSVGYAYEYDIKGFLDGSVPLPEEEYRKLPLPVLGNYRDYKPDGDDVFTCAVGSPRGRKEFIETVEGNGGKFINIIHTTAIVQGSARLGKGVILCPYTSVNADATVGKYVLVNYMSTLGHDVRVGDYSAIMGHVDLCGFVKVGSCTFIGSGARVLPSGTVGNNAFVGAGSVVLKNVNANTKVFGNPARLTV